MTLMESKTTSKTSCLKALLLRAWRERWSDLQWGKNIKTVLPRGVSGDVYNLADCILQQALVGSGANQLVLSYLMHSLSSQLVSHAAVLQRLGKFTQHNKTHCILSLLDFLEGILPGVTCCGKSDETKLASALLATTNWLLQILQHCGSTGAVSSLSPTTAVEQQLFEKAIAVLRKLLSSHFNVAMMCLARYNDAELYSDICRRCCDLESLYKSNADVLEYVRLLIKLDVSSISPAQPLDAGPGCLVQAWLAVQLVGRPDSPTQELADRLRLIGRLKGYSEARLYCEVIRGSFQVLRDVGQTPHESQWGAFAFLKVPHILAALAQDYQISLLHQHQKEPATTAVFSAVEMLTQHPSLLDGMDTSSSCSSLECLLGELTKCGLLTDAHVRHLCETRGNQAPPPKLDTSMATSSAGIPKVIICAEPTLAGILKTLSTDYHKIQDAILGMLHQVLTGKSFELILAVATVQGQLRTLVQRLIRFNECSKVLQGGQGGDKARAQLFDISFLMLVAIVQNYDTDAVLDPHQEGDSLLESWVRTSMVEANRPKAPDGPLKMCDPTFVDALLQQFNAGESDFKAPVKWQDVLFNIPGVMKEVLVAWEQGALMAADVKRILDAVRGRMCCLPLAAAAWLCNYMRTVPHEYILKPINMVQQLLAPPLIAEDENLRERWQLTCEIIQKMQRDVKLMLRPKSGVSQLVSRQPAADQLKSLWQSGVARGWLEHRGAGTVHTLLETAGSRWLVSAVIRELLLLRNRIQLERAVDLALALFHTDIRQCALHLLTDSLPQLLLSNGGNSSFISNTTTSTNSNLPSGAGNEILNCSSNLDGNVNCHTQIQQLMEPQLSALATLTGYTVYAAAATYERPTLSEEVDCEPPSAKIRRPNDLLNTVGSLEAERNPPISALRQLLTSLETSMQDGSITQQMYFALHLLKCLVDARPPQHKPSLVLNAIPAALISQLLRTLPEQFTPSVILQLHDIHSIAGRTAASRDLCVLRNHQLRHTTSTNNPTYNLTNNSNN